ncbi:hypothetical protein ALC60_07510, partial [Trachymyrmex zeteki]
THEQSESAIWHVERAVRISASRAHAIKTRRSNFDQLAVSLLNEKPLTGKARTNVLYGSKNENSAREMYQNIGNVSVEQCGLVIHPSQPWLCASPDGLLMGDGKPLRVIEIKCPISCKNKPIIGSDREINVSYIQKTSTGFLELKKTHTYYTQCQILILYIVLD